MTYNLPLRALRLLSLIISKGSFMIGMCRILAAPGFVDTTAVFKAHVMVALRKVYRVCKINASAALLQLLKWCRLDNRGSVTRHTSLSWPPWRWFPGLQTGGPIRRRKTTGGWNWKALSRVRYGVRWKNDSELWIGKCGYVEGNFLAVEQTTIHVIS
jgi:hypothetical protein